MKTFDPAHCNKLATLSITKSRYIALLTSMHMNFLYTEDPDSASFLKEQHNLQKKWRQELGITKQEIEKTYSLLEWCDACSLLLCQDQVQPEHRSIEISTGPESNKFHLAKINDDKLTIVPWPFQLSQFNVYFETRLIEQLHFKSSAEFRKHFFEAQVKEESWTLTKSKIPKSSKK